MKKICFIFLLLLSLFLINRVDAASYKGRLYEVYHPNSGFTVFASSSISSMDYNSWIIKSTADKRVYYCIEPELALSGASKGSHKYLIDKSNVIKNSKLTTSKYNKVQLLAYYGYGYKDNNVNHTSKKWYGITQVMIWRVMRSDLKWTFKANRSSKPNKKLYLKEVNELNKLVKEHSIKPSFSGKKVKLLVGETIEINDKNGVFSNYSLKGIPKNVKVSRVSNKIRITAIKTGNETLSYSKSSRTSEKFALFYSTKYQDVVSVGKPSLPSFSLNVEVSDASVTVKKVDSSTNSFEALGDANLSGAVYGIYNSSNELVTKITIGSKGEAKAVLGYGNYKIKELEAPLGYKISDKVYEFKIDRNNASPVVVVSDDVIKGRILLKKRKGGLDEEMTVEAGAKFEVVSSSNKLVKTLITDENGEASADLAYGKYTIRQIKGAFGYSIVNSFVIEVKEEKTYTYNLDNVKFSKLIFEKKDSVLGKVLPGAEIDVFDSSDKVIYSGITDKNGRIEIDNLQIGRYYIVEKKAPKYYKLDNKKIYFEVPSNGKEVNVTMENERKKGSLEFFKTDSGGKKGLSGALIEIYFKETNKLIFKGETNKDGIIKVDDLFAGEYCLYEKRAPKGYAISKKPICFDIQNDKQLVKVNMKNDMVVKIPETGGYKFDYLLLLLTLLLGSVIFYAKA